MSYRLDSESAVDGRPLGSTARAGLAGFLRFVRGAGVGRALAERVHLPVQERRTGFTVVQKSLALLAALAAGCRSARDGDFVLAPDPTVGASVGLPRWPHSSQLTRHLRAFRPQHVDALRGATEDVLAAHSTVRRRLRRGERVVIDVDQTAISANGRTYERTARGHLRKKGDRGYQATAAFAGDPGGGDDEVLAVFLDPGNTHASRRFADLLAAFERVLGPLERLSGLVLRFDCQYATADDLALLLGRGIRFVGRVYADRTAESWAREYGLGLTWTELSPIKWVADLGAGPIAASRPGLTCRRLLVRSTGARHRAGYTAIVTNLPPDELATDELERFYEARQTIEGWLSEATAALQLKGLWSRSFAGLEAFLLHAALVSNLLNWWERRELLPASGLPHLGLRQLIGRVITLPARVLRTAEGQLALLLPPTHPYARRLVPTGPACQLPLPFTDLRLRDAHF
ncbi:MAG TPA: transposase [Solirubrobacteraceae bacterium]|nr:transposase [Solirubrobacteraceae bacterium]